MFDIVIVNWNSGDLLRDCLLSIPAGTQNSKNIGAIIVVDNNSSDDSLERLSEIDLPVQIIRLATNEGFAKACNLGARACSGENILFLNPDTNVVEGAFDGVEELLSHDQSVGIVGLQLVDEAENIHRSCARFPRFLDLLSNSLGLHVLLGVNAPNMLMVEWNHDEDRDVDHVTGAALFIRRNLFERLGGFDERFFLYLEDLDLCLRVRDLGKRVRYQVSGQVMHVGGGTSRTVPATRLFYQQRSRNLFTRKHWRLAPRIVVNAVGLFVEPWVRIGGALVRGEKQGIEQIMNATLRLWRWWVRTLLTEDREGMRKG